MYFSSRQLRAFLVAAEELNMRRAAERLFISQPGLSLSIQQLERETGVRLFDRTPGGLRLTEAGVLWQERAGQIISLADGAVKEARALASAPRTVRVGYLHSVGADLLPRLIMGFEREHPDVPVETMSFDLSDPSAGLSEGIVDVAVSRGPILDTHAHTLDLQSEQWAVCLPLNHSLSSRTVVDVGELLDEPVIAAPESAGRWRDFWTAADARSGRPARVTAVAATIEAEYLAVARGQGVSFTTVEAVRHFRPPGVCFVPIADMEPARTTMAWRSAHPDVLRFVDHVRDACSKPFGEPIA